MSITEAKSGIERADAQKIVRIIRSLRESGVCEFTPTVRGCIMVAKAMKVQGGSISAGAGLFRQLGLGIPASECTREEMVMNVAFLVHRTQQQQFDDRVRRLDELFQKEIAFRAMGPLPPYSFLLTREDKGTHGVHSPGFAQLVVWGRPIRELAAASPSPVLPATRLV